MTSVSEHRLGGAYREAPATQGAPDAMIERRSIVLAHEPVSPTKRLIVVDYNDGSIAVQFRAPGRAGTIAMYAAAMLLMVGVIFAAIAGRWICLEEICEGALLALWMLAHSLHTLIARPMVIEELAIGGSGLVWQRASSGRKEIVSLSLIDAVALDGTVSPVNLILKCRRNELRIVESTYTSQPLEVHELMWLAGRLRRALVRLRA